MHRFLCLWAIFRYSANAAAQSWPNMLGLRFCPRIRRVQHQRIYAEFNQHLSELPQVTGLATQSRSSGTPQIANGYPTAQETAP